MSARDKLYQEALDAFYTDDSNEGIEHIKDGFIYGYIAHAEKVGSAVDVKREKARAWHEGFCVGERSGAREVPMNPHEHNPYKTN